MICYIKLIRYHVNNKGILIDIDSVKTEILESDGVKGGSLVETNPDYYVAEDFFQDLIAEFEE